ncbi:pectin acetylesterase [Trifolium medium]|uniref:Pectin acetylesterase n=1 Tax=Trifolium medium TaxID=97028 RepID=A0A392P2J5_9FABA|nr:pectin acetylesterase [Trifolium medium]
MGPQTKLVNKSNDISSQAVKSFAQVVSNVCDIPLNQLPQPCVKGDRTAILIPEDEYRVGIETCQHNLHGRIIWPKGVVPLKIDVVRSKLAPGWKSLAKWEITSLGKSFYEFSFSSLEDVQTVRSVGSWNLSPGLLKLFTWSKDFNPNIQHQTTAQVWVRIYGLSQEYWRPKILFAIAGSVGTPICIDSATNKSRFERDFGHFVRVLVDMDLRIEPKYKILVERIGFALIATVLVTILVSSIRH